MPPEDPRVPPGTLEVDADLELTIEGQAAQVRGEGSTLVLDLPSAGAARRILRSLPPASSARESVHDLDSGLRAVGLTLDVRVDGVTVARSGSAARPGGVSRLLGTGEIELRPGALLQSTLRPAAALGMVSTLALGGVLYALLKRR